MNQVAWPIGPGFQLLPAPSYGRTTEFLKCLFMQQAGHFCYLHPTMGQLRCYETCSQPARKSVAKAKRIADTWRLTLLSPACSHPSCLSIHSKSTKDRAQQEPLSPALPAKSQGVGGSCPGLAGQQGCAGCPAHTSHPPAAPPR